MAKAQKSTDKKSPPSKSSTKEAPKKVVAKTSRSEPPKREAAKPAPKAAAPAPKAAEAPRPSAKEAAKETVRSLAKPNPELGQVRAHPDAKLTKTEITSLFQKLVDEKNRVLGNFERHVDDALSDEDILADEIDIAQRSTDQAWLFRMADKDRKLLIEIDAALEKMKTGEYGLCEGTDEPIGFKRLELRPWTRYSVAYKEMLEREKAQQAR
ncbi:MAG: TraR/DksA C4-type zinc finger protein [Sandaracinus sp.]